MDRFGKRDWPIGKLADGRIEWDQVWKFLNGEDDDQPLDLDALTIDELKEINAVLSEDDSDVRHQKAHERMRRNAQRNLRALLNDLEALAEEAAAAPGADKERRDLPEVVGELRCAVTQVESKMKPSGAYDLHQALLMAVHVVSLLSNDQALRVELEKLREKSNAPLKARQEAAIKVKELVWQMRDNGRTAQEIQGDLAAEGPHIERSLSWIYATIAERSST
jgi:hypothetical protein